MQDIDNSTFIKRAFSSDENQPLNHENTNLNKVINNNQIKKIE